MSRNKMMSAFHEACHAVIAYRQKLPIERVLIWYSEADEQWMGRIIPLGLEKGDVEAAKVWVEIAFALEHLEHPLLEAKSEKEKEFEDSANHMHIIQAMKILSEAGVPVDEVPEIIETAEKQSIELTSELDILPMAEHLAESIFENEEISGETVYLILDELRQKMEQK